MFRAAAASQFAAILLVLPVSQDPEEHPVADIAQLGHPFGQGVAPEDWPAALVRSLAAGFGCMRGGACAGVHMGMWGVRLAALT